jgi:hypothetical protein
MNNELQGLKELYGVTLKSTYPIEMGNRKIEPGEVIAAFDNIQIGGLQELKDRVAARGGFDNRAWVSWETTKEIPLSFTQGVFSIEHLSLISNSRLVEAQKINEPIMLTERELLESSENGTITLKREPKTNLFLYDKDTGERLNYTASGKELIINEPYKDVYVTYDWEYTNHGKIIQVGRRLLNGYLKLEARTRLKENENGRTVTGIIQIPRLKLMSDLSIRLGQNANPATVNFNAVGVPVGGKGTSYVCNFITLSEDIDS